MKENKALPQARVLQMPIPLQITFRNLDPSAAVEDAVRRRAERLERFSDRITGCRVTIEAPHKHRHKGKLYDVRIDIRTPKEEIAVTHTGPQDHAHEDVYVAVRDAFAAAVRLLEDHVRKIRGTTKLHEVPLHGRIVRLMPYEGYGFVETSDGREIYFHKNSVTGAGFDKLETGAEVKLVVAENESPQGPQATTVTAVGKHHPVD